MRSETTSYTEIETPGPFWRAISAAIYIVPAIDSWQLGVYAVYQHMPDLFQPVRMFVMPWDGIYTLNQFVPLLVFFFVFLVVVRNKKLHHFVRFNAMQAMMCDILVMLPMIVNRYLPGDIFWSPWYKAFHSLVFVTVAVCILWFKINTMLGIYANIPFVTEACLMQVQIMEST